MAESSERCSLSEPASSTPAPKGGRSMAGRAGSLKRDKHSWASAGTWASIRRTCCAGSSGNGIAEVGGYLTTLDKRDPEGQLIDLDDNAYLTLKTEGGIVGSMILSWTNYGQEENYTVIYCTNGVLSIGTNPTYGLIVDYRNGDQELHKLGAMSSNAKQVASGVIDSVHPQHPPEQAAGDGWP